MVEEWEKVEKSIREMDTVFAAVTGIVFASITALTALAMMWTGPAGIVFMFVVWLVAIPTWGKLVKTWMDERLKLLREATTPRLEHGFVEELARELSKLRESIEALRRTLES